MVFTSDYIIIPTADGRAQSFQRPFDEGRYWRDSFAPIARFIRYEYGQKKINAAGGRRDGANRWLMRVVYDLLIPMFEDEQLDEIKEWLDSHGRYERLGLPVDANPFQLGLMAIFAEQSNEISHQTRERLWKRLWHAARHFVPNEFLSGFISQLDSHGLEQRAAENEIEPGFEHWIAKSYSTASSPIGFGTYPPRILELVQEYTALNSDD